MGTPPIAVQRVSVWWTKAGRDARSADLRRGLPEVFPLPDLPEPQRDHAVLLHNVEMWERWDYAAREEARYVSRSEVPWSLRLSEHGGLLTVSRAPGGTEAFPRRWPRPLFTLRPGEVGRYRANFRFTAASHESDWLYSDWILRIGHRAWHTSAPAVDVDDRVHLYGG
ncbi:hypothetical protein [Nocardiopsis sp. CC223A]|uniref:hypothetical protein n=1 Tax=Nocardiopsis sp. CC223A TaxID=3044051 RepID=UPI00278C5650|nr:hypothetical protein [Nocardiopsis sp. CC223A]